MEARPRSLRILIAEDHPLMRAGLRQDLEDGGLDVCAEAPTGAEAVTAALRERPDVCLLDVHMPGGDGIAATEVLRRELPATKIVLITAAPDKNGALAAARAGAHGYLSKDLDGRMLPKIVQAVANGETAHPGG